MSEIIDLHPPACPYCGSQLKKPPKRKAACKSCGEPIYVRSTQQIFPTQYLTEEQAKAVDWVATLGNYGIGLPTYREVEAELIRLSGTAPPLEVVRGMIYRLEELQEGEAHLWQLARFQSEMGEDATPTLRKANRETLRKYKASGRLGSVEITADRCCEVCRLNHGKTYDLQNAEPLPDLPPDDCLRHQPGGSGLCNCRYSVNIDFLRELRSEELSAPVRSINNRPVKAAGSGCLGLLLTVTGLAAAMYGF